MSCWLSGIARPGWDGICDMSFVYQQHLQAFIGGPLSEITVTEPFALPISVLPRQGARRRSPVKRDVAKVEQFLGKVAAGHYPAIISVAGAAARLGVAQRELRRIAPLATKALTECLAIRRRQKVIAAALERAKRVKAISKAIADDLVAANTRPTRRLICDEMDRQGCRLSYHEQRLVLGEVLCHWGLARGEQHPSDPDKVSA